MAYTLGSIPIENRVLCAPICGATKLPYRRLARRFGADLCYTEMIKAVALVRGTERSYQLAQRVPEEGPVGAQICGVDSREMAEAARIIEGLGFSTLDINMGCPVPKIVRDGAGAALMKDLPGVERVVRACAEAVAIPVTVKIRSGWTKGQVNAVDVTRAAEQGGAQMVSIHGRPRSHGHRGEIDYETIAAVKRAVSIPVVGNGGIFAPEDARRMIDRTGCDAVMIGRGGYGRPWFFRDCALALRGEPAGPAPTPRELGKIISGHFQETLEILGPVVGARCFRKCCAWYFKDRPYGTYFRDLGFRSSTPAELAEIIEAWIGNLESCERAEATGAALPLPAIVQRLCADKAPAWLQRPARLSERARELSGLACESS